MYSITQKYDPNYPKSFFLYIWDMGFMIDDILGQRTKKREVIFSSYISLFPECLSDVITFSILIPKTISEVVTWGAKCDHNIKFSSWLSFTYIWHIICRVLTEKKILHKVWNVNPEQFFIILLQNSLSAESENNRQRPTHQAHQ